MKIYLATVGSIKEKYLKDAISEYSKRISKFAQVEILSVSDEATPDNPSQREIDVVKDKEGDKLLKVIPSNCYKIALDLKGVMLSSEELAKKMLDIYSYSSPNICFIIGGSLGISKKVLDVCDYKLCFSKMTFPHQLMQVILLEQVYRAYKINNNEAYHK